MGRPINLYAFYSILLIYSLPILWLPVHFVLNDINTCMKSTSLITGAALSWSLKSFKLRASLAPVQRVSIKVQQLLQFFCLRNWHKILVISNLY